MDNETINKLEDLNMLFCIKCKQTAQYNSKDFWSLVYDSMPTEADKIINCCEIPHYKFMHSHTIIEYFEVTIDL